MSEDETTDSGRGERATGDVTKNGGGGSRGEDKEEEDEVGKVGGVNDFV